MKYISGLVVLLVTLLLPYSVTASAKKPSHVLFINQTRGEECCDKGSLAHLQIQINAFIKNTIPAYFALRYDALSDPRYLNLLQQYSRQHPNLIKVGILFEVTPELAKKAGVAYVGKPEKWYEGQTVFSIGYSVEDNKKLADVLFEKFHEGFNSYPEVTSSWMMETRLLNYLQEKYSVKVHQITREQWGTDSYTLYGGPPHYPYPASKNWLFLPEYTRKDAPLIVRQTVIDPLLNYGDRSNAFTSQPNDYANDKKTFDYFVKLIDQAVLKQPQTGFALLGLENSMNENFQKEYVKQIEYIKTLVDKGEVTFPDTKTIVSFWKAQKQTVYWGGDLVQETKNEAYWITTPTYRVRLRVQNNAVFISDIRLFNQEYRDPYSSTKAQKEGFWIVPYLLDGSLWYKKESENDNLVPTSLLTWNDVYTTPQKDTIGEPTRIDLPSKKENSSLKVETKADSVSLIYKKPDETEQKLVFNQDSVQVLSAEKKEVKFQNHLPQGHPLRYIKEQNGFQLQWIFEDKATHGLKTNCSTKECVISFTSTANELDDMRKKQHPYLFPEPVIREVSKDKTKFIVNNRYAVANKSFVRLTVVPYDVYGVPTTLSEEMQVKADFSINIVQNIESKVPYVDFYSQTPGTSIVSVTLPNSVVKQERVYFAPDCKKALSTCIKKPSYLIWYLRSGIGIK